MDNKNLDYYLNEILTVEYKPLRTLVHRVFPDVNQKIFSYIVFISDKTRKYVFNRNLMKDDVSLRTYKALREGNYSSWREIALCNYTELRALPGIGDVALSEIKGFVHRNIRFEQTKSLELITQYIIDFSKSYLIGHESIINPLDIDINKYLSKNGYDDIYFQPLLIFRNKNFNKFLVQSDSFIKALSEDVLKAIPACDSWKDLNGYLSMYPDFFNDVKLATSVTNYLVSHHKIAKNKSGNYEKILKPMAHWAKQLAPMEHDLLVARLQGLSITETAKKLGISRQKVTRLEMDLLSFKPDLIEDKYGYWFSKYALSADDMKEIFGIDNVIYNYFCIAYKQGNLPALDMLSDNKVDESVRPNILKFVNKGSVVLFRKRIPGKRDDVLRCVIEHECLSRSWKMHDFYDYYHKLLKTKKLDMELFSFPNENIFSSKVYDTAIFDFYNNLRYYPIQIMRIRGMVNKLKLNKYKNIEISSLKIYSDNKAVMNQYDIRDHYELFDVLNLSKDIWNADKYNISFKHKPTMDFGNVDMEAQLINLLKKCSPIKKGEFTKLFEIYYGISDSAFNSSWNSFLAPYLFKGTCIYNAKRVTKKQDAFFKKNLKEDFYFLEDIKETYCAELEKDIDDYDLVVTMTNYGFNVFADYAIRNTYATASDYFNEFFLKNDFLDLNDIDPRILRNQVAGNSLRSYKKNMDLVEISTNDFVTYARFIERYPFMTKKSVIAYSKEVASFTKSAFFTIPMLNDMGFTSDLSNKKHSTLLFELLLKNVSDMNSFKLGNRYIFRKKNLSCSFDDFVKYLMGKKSQILMSDLIEKIINIYKIRIESDIIKIRFTNSTLYYEPLVDTIYIDKEAFLKEL